MAPEVAGSSPVTHPTPPPRALRRLAAASLVCLALLAAACSRGSAGTPAAGTHAAGMPAAGAAGATQGRGGANHPTAAGRPYVVLVSFDGFRADYLDRFPTPNFDRLAADGARAALVSVFPSLTFPAHYSLATGLYPERHGIVGNRFHDPQRGDEFDYRDRGDAQDGAWWGGEPIWVTAERQGLRSAAFFFPGTEADIGGVRPTEWRPYDGSVPNRDRVRTVVGWLARPPETRPHLTTLYFSLVDSAGHRFGPEAPALQASVEEADKLLGALLDGVAALPHAARVAVVVVSDHGMAAVDAARRQTLPAAARGPGVRAVPLGPAVGLHIADPARRRPIRDAINESLEDARAYLRAEMPARLHARASPRLGDVIVVPEVGVMVALGRGGSSPAGMHGWDPHEPAMHGILVAAGPGIARGARLPTLESVHVYPLVAQLLGLAPPPALDGNLEAAAGLLAPAPTPGPPGAPAPEPPQPARRPRPD